MSLTITPSGKLRVPKRRKPVDWVLVALWISLFVVTLIWFIPFVLMFFTSLKSTVDINTSYPWQPPVEVDLGNYTRAIERGQLWTTASNSAIVALVKVPIGLLLAALAAFAVARIRFGVNKLALGLFAVGSMVPIQVGLGTLFSTMLGLDLLDTKLGLMLPYTAFGIPMKVFLLYGFFRAIPMELEETSRLDGVSNWKFFWLIALPLAKPALAALFIIDFVGTWNEYAIAVTLLSSRDQWTIPLAVQSFSNQYGTDYGELNAFIFMSAIPVLVVYLLFQRYFVQGIFSGSIK